MPIFILWAIDYRRSDVIGVFDSLEKAKAIAEMDMRQWFGGVLPQWVDDSDAHEWTYGDEFYSYHIRQVKMNSPI